MNWRLTAGLLRLLKRIPGYRVNNAALQDVRASLGYDAGEMRERSPDLLALCRASSGQGPPDHCLEIGAGLCPWLPLLPRAWGDTRVPTLDINSWLWHNVAIAPTLDLSARLESVAPVVSRRTGELDAQAARAGSGFQNAQLHIHTDLTRFIAAELSNDNVWPARVTMPDGEPARIP